jgi:hypothetical protein
MHRIHGGAFSAGLRLSRSGRRLDPPLLFLSLRLGVSLGRIRNSRKDARLSRSGHRLDPPLLFLSLRLGALA